MEKGETKADAKMELIQISRDLMPAGKPNFLDMIKHPQIKDMAKDIGQNTMLKVLFLMIKDFCNSVNVVRNMNEDQMIESASMLLDECDNFRLEDYVMMFSMAKRGDLVKIMDRLDISIITQMLDEYWKRRKYAGNRATAEPVDRLDGLGTTTKQIETMHPADAKMLHATDNLAGIIGEMKAKFTKDVKNISEEEAKKQLVKPKERLEWGKQEDGAQGFVKT